MNYSKLFRNSSENLQFLYQSIEQHIKTLPKGELRVYRRERNERVYASIIYYKPDGTHQNIKTNHALLEKLALKMFLEKELLRIGALIHTCNLATEASDALSINAIMQEIPAEIRPYIPFNNGWHSVKDQESIRKERLAKWKAEPYEGNPFSDCPHKHRTSDGTLVKSKSELIIYEKLLQYGITFKYEAPVKIGYKNYYPDFTIMLPDRRIIYWEHAGMMNKESYVMRHKEKMAAYETVNIVPWRNLIVTYDDENENLDIRIIESEIINKLLV